MNAFFSLPFWLVMLVLVGAAVTVACSAHTVVHRIVPYSKLVEHNDVAGFVIAVVGVLYAVLISFVVVVVWQQYDEADARYGDEVTAAADIFTFARTLAPEAGRAVQQLVARYIGEMIHDEWPEMLAGGRSAAATATLTELAATAASAPSQTLEQNGARAHEQESIQHLFDLRNRRLSDNARTLPPVLWAALLGGATITVGFGFLFGVENFRIQLVMTGAVAALIALMFSLLIELDFPFQRDTALTAARWIELQQYLARAGLALPPAPLRPAHH